MPTRWLGAWSNGVNGSECSWSIRLLGGGKTSVSSLGVWDKRNLPYDALQRGVLSPLSKTYPRKRSAHRATPPAGRRTAADRTGQPLARWRGGGWCSVARGGRQGERPHRG